MRRMRSVAAVIASASLVLLGAQQESDDILTRQLWDRKFQSKRPPTGHPPQTKLRRPPVQNDEEAYIGVTLWRLRPSKSDDEPAARKLIHPPETNKEEDWTPERCEANAPLAQGQMVRLSIEAAREGYLYVVDREKYADGTYSEGELIFPTLRIHHGKNKVVPGNPVEIPSWDDSPPYFVVQRNHPNQVAEVLTVIVAPERIGGLSIGRDQAKISNDQLTKWEKTWGADVKQLGAAGQAGKAYTKAEADAGKSLGLLHADDPLPQTMYSLKARPGEPFLVTVPLTMN